MTFTTLDDLVHRLQALGARRILAKPLAENDNTKQQVYLGGSFASLNQLPYTQLQTSADGTAQTIKATLQLSWIDAQGQVESAPHAKLILYPRYPEVRLSGFLRGCSIAPAALMQPVPRHLRRHNNGNDGRVLFLGVADSGTVYAYLAPSGSSVAGDFLRAHAAGRLQPSGVFWAIGTADRATLLVALRNIHVAGWHQSIRLNNAGIVMPYRARNGGGYTLEALLGIRPNGRSEPDFMGWEVKAYGRSRITLMTPEPDAGFYGVNGVEAFVRKYGRDVGNDVLYFTGQHRVGSRCRSTSQTLLLRGFDPATSRITDVNGGIELTDSTGSVSAGWSFAGLLQHWGRKHAFAAYVPYTCRSGPPPAYWYRSPVLLGEGTEFPLFLRAMSDGRICYDPAPKVERASTTRPKVKARSQFRIGVPALAHLYNSFSAVSL